MSLDTPTATDVPGLIALQTIFNADFDVTITFPANLGYPTRLLESIVRNPTLWANGRHFDFHLTSSVAIKEVEKFSERTIWREESTNDFLVIQLHRLHELLKNIDSLDIHNEEKREVIIAVLAISYGLLRNPDVYFAHAPYRALYEGQLDNPEFELLNIAVTATSRVYASFIASIYEALKLIENFQPWNSTDVLWDNIKNSLAQVMNSIIGIISSISSSEASMQQLHRTMNICHARWVWLLPNP